MAVKYLNELKIRQVNSEGEPEIHQLKLRSGALDMTNINSNIAVAWANVFDKPAVLDFNAISVSDTRAVTSVPEDIPSRAVSFEFKQNASVGNPPNAAANSYSHIINIAGWNSNEGSGGWPSQISVGASSLAVRQATSATAWGSWKDLSKPAWSDVSGKPAQATRWPEWSEVTSKPTTATRWPTWSEVTGKPSTFAPSSHTHSYLPLSGGTLTGNLNMPGRTISTDYIDGGKWQIRMSNESYIFLRQGTNSSTIRFYPDSGDIWFSGSITAGTVPWARLTGQPAQVTRWPTWSEVSNKPSTFAPSSHTHSRSQTTLRGATSIAAGGNYSLSQSILNFDMIIIHFSTAYSDSSTFNADTFTLYPHGHPTSGTTPTSVGYGGTGRWVSWRFTSTTNLHCQTLVNPGGGPRIRAVYGIKFTS